MLSLGSHERWELNKYSENQKSEASTIYLKIGFPVKFIYVSEWILSQNNEAVAKSSVPFSFKSISCHTF